MFSVFDQENLANAHQTTAASKPLNQSIRQLQSRTPGTTLKTPFGPRNDENRPLNTGKVAQNSFATPAPRARAPLGAKTTNAKTRAFQTPAQLDKANDNLQASKRSSLARRSLKRNTQALQESIAKEEQQPSVEDDSEPEFGYAPPPVVPLLDPPLEFDYDTSYACLRPEKFTQGVGEVYFQSPKDENGFSISSKREEEAFKKSLEHDLNKILETPLGMLPDPDEEVDNMMRRGSKRMAEITTPNEETRERDTKINTIQSRTAAAKLSHLVDATRPKLPAAVNRETASSKQKRKPTFAVSKDSDNLQKITRCPPPPKATIGFPKAKKAPSIIPREGPAARNNRVLPNRDAIETREELPPNQSQISPRKFVALYGEPPVESEMWFRLKELEIRDRRREDIGQERDQPTDDALFPFDEDVDVDRGVNDKLAVMFEMEDADDFEL